MPRHYSRQTRENKRAKRKAARRAAFEFQKTAPRAGGGAASSSARRQHDAPGMAPGKPRQIQPTQITPPPPGTRRHSDPLFKVEVSTDRPAEAPAAARVDNPVGVKNPGPHPDPVVEKLRRDFGQMSRHILDMKRTLGRLNVGMSSMHSRQAGFRDEADKIYQDWRKKIILTGIHNEILRKTTTSLSARLRSLEHRVENLKN